MFQNTSSFEDSSRNDVSKKGGLISFQKWFNICRLISIFKSIYIVQSSFVLDINSWVYCQLVTCQCPVGYSSVASQPTVGWHVFSRNFSSQLLTKTPNTVTKRKDAAVLLINVYPLHRVPLFYINTRASFKHSNHFPSIKVH